MKPITAVISAALLLAASSVRAAEAPKVIDVKVTGHGQPVILIPGLGTPGAIWEETVKHLQDKYECHVVTIAGFGGMPAVKTDNLLDDARTQIIAYARAQMLAKPTIVGHSLGGTLALLIGEKAPDLPGDIVSVDGLPFLAGVMLPGVTDLESANRAAAAMHEKMKSQTREQALAFLKNVSIPGMVTKPADQERVYALCAKSDGNTVNEAMGELLTRDYRPELGKIKCPILVMGALAQISKYAPKATIEATYKNQFKNAPQTRFQFFDNAKHFIMVDDPAGFYAALDKELAAQ